MPFSSKMYVAFLAVGFSFVFAAHIIKKPELVIEVSSLTSEVNAEN